MFRSYYRKLPSLRKQILFDRLQAAYRAGNYKTWNHLADKSGVPHANISRLRRKKPNPVNPSTVSKLAEELHVPADWLTGEAEHLPFVAKHGLLHGGTDTDPELVNVEKVQLSWLLRRVNDALLRDLVRFQGHDSGGETHETIGPAFRSAIRELCSVVAWRMAFNEPLGDPIVIIHGSWSGEERRFVTEINNIRWVTDCLEPWLAGHTELKCNALKETLTARYEHEGHESSSMIAAQFSALTIYESLKTGAKDENL